MNFKLEIIGFNIESCMAAEQAGAHRIELCDNPGEGGTTASYGFIKKAREKLLIDLFPIIRPRGGDFLYSNDEFDMMKTDVQHCKNLGCDGIVIGMLTADARIDKLRCSQLVNMAYPMEATFHRAFDRTIDFATALEDVIDIGCTRILSSGLYPHALAGKENIKALVSLAAGRIIVMPGSGVRSQNIVELATGTGAVEFHSSARMVLPTKMEAFNATMNENMESYFVDENEIKKMASLLTAL